MSEQSNLPATPAKRETHDIILPSGRAATLVTRLLGRNIRDIDRASLRSVKVQKTVGANGEAAVGPVLEKVSLAQCQEDQENELLKCVVVAIDGDPENVFERTLDLDSADWAVVLQEAKNLQAPATK